MTDPDPQPADEPKWLKYIRWFTLLCVSWSALINFLTWQRGW